MKNNDHVFLSDEKDTQTGALICTPDIFAKIYFLEKKRIKRRKNSSLLIKINLTQLNDSNLRKQFISKLSQKLRAGDVIASEEGNGVYILIYNIDISDFLIVVKRIIKLAAISGFKFDIEIDWEEISINNCTSPSKILCKL